jgi:hypothetical protein
VGGRLLELAELPLRQRQVVVRLGVFRIELERSRVFGHGFLAPAVLEQRPAEGIAQLDVVRRDLDPAPECALGALVVAGVLVGHSGAQERVRIQELLADVGDRVPDSLTNSGMFAARSGEVKRSSRTGGLSLPSSSMWVRKSCVYAVLTFDENTSQRLFDDQLCQEFMRAVL